MTKRESTLQANSNFGSDTPVRLRYSSSAQILQFGSDTEILRNSKFGSDNLINFLLYIKLVVGTFYGQFTQGEEDNLEHNCIGQLPRVSGEDPERIRVDSVVETSVCLFFSCKQIFSFFVL